MWKDWQRREWARGRLGMGRVIRWNWWAVLRYTHLQVGKSDLRQQRRVLCVGEHLCRLYRMKEETGVHLVFGWEGDSSPQLWNRSSWVKLDDKKKWKFILKGEGGKDIVWDRVEDFFRDLDDA